MPLTAGTRLGAYAVVESFGKGDMGAVYNARDTKFDGDAFLGKRIPFLDAANGAGGIALPELLQQAHDTIRNVDTIITGHSMQATWANLNEWAAINRDFLEMVRASRLAGRTVDEMASAWTMPTKYVGYGPPNAAGVTRNIQTIVDKFED